MVGYYYTDEVLGLKSIIEVYLEEKRSKQSYGSPRSLWFAVQESRLSLASWHCLKVLSAESASASVRRYLAHA